MSSRRALLIGATLAGILPLRRMAAAEGSEGLNDALASLERRHGGRLGVAVIDGRTSTLASYRGDEIFPFCSTYKALAAAFVLARVDRGQESLSRRVTYGTDVLVPYSPVTKRFAGTEGMTVGDICEAAVTVSDNTAGNLLLDSFGGPAGLTAYMRSLGDSVTRSDRYEPALNEAVSGDPRDTTTPVAMAGALRTCVLGSALSDASRDRLATWLVGCKTGDTLLRSGMPKDWRVGDKSGAGEHNTRNDIAIVWPPGRPPIVVTGYYTGSSASDAERDAVLSEVGRLVTMA